MMMVAVGKTKHAGWPARGLVAVLATLLLAGCTIEPQPVHLGSEECAHCRMVISEREYAAQALNAKGKPFKFDAIECMANWALRGEEVPTGEIHSLWVTDAAEPDRWIRVEDASFVRSERVHSPMGAGLIAHATAQDAREHSERVGGEVLDWEGVLETIRERGGYAHAAHGH